MLILLGEFTRKNSRAGYLLEKYNWGRMWSKRVHIKPEELVPGEPLGFDNGAYMYWNKKTPLHWRDFPESLFIRRLELLPKPPIVAVAPDLPLAGNNSLLFSLWWVRQLPRLPWYLAIQDGMDAKQVESSLDEFAGVFLGGSNTLKLEAADWCSLAKRRGKKFHYGRCSTFRRVRDARMAGADSVDSVTPVLRISERKRDGRRAFARWVQEATDTNPQKELFT